MIIWTFILIFSFHLYAQDFPETAPLEEYEKTDREKSSTQKEQHSIPDMQNARRSVFTVTNNNDSGAGSLRDAIALANGNAGDDEIVFSLVYPATIILTGTTITINSAATSGKLKISGPGSSQLTISGNKTIRIFVLASGADLDISGVTMVDSQMAGDGACFYNWGTLTIHDCIFSYNNVTGNGGVILNRASIPSISNCTFSNNTSSSAGGAILNRGTITTLSNCTFSNNTASGWGGSIYNQGGAIINLTDCIFTNNSSSWGGALEHDSMNPLNANKCNFSNNTASHAAIYIRGLATLTQCTISNNGNASGIGISPASTIVTINECTFSENNSSGNGGACYNLGPNTTINACTFFNNIAASNGGAFFNDGTYTCAAVIKNCTFFNNTSTNGKGGAASNGNNANLTISNCTFYGNFATTSSGGGVSNEGAINMDNNIVAGNTASSSPDVYGTITSNGYNLIGDPIGSTGWIDDDLMNLNPKLDNLSNNGGPTMTMALLPGSPAMDAGDPLSSLTADQRGIIRPVNNKIDIGAFEMNTPGINLQGKGVDIPSGSDNPTTENDTDFGSTLVNGEAVVHTFSIQNLGAVNLLVYDITAGSDFSIQETPDTITPGSSSTFQIVFRPRSQGIKTATIVINNNDRTYSFLVSGRGDIDTSIIVEIAPLSTNFGNVRVRKASASHTFTIKNKTSDLLAQLSLSNSNRDEFIVSHFPDTLAGGAIQNFTIKFRPKYSGARMATLTIEVNDTSRGHRSYIYLICSGFGDYRFKDSSCGATGIEFLGFLSILALFRKLTKKGKQNLH